MTTNESPDRHTPPPALVPLLGIAALLAAAAGYWMLEARGFFRRAEVPPVASASAPAPPAPGSPLEEIVDAFAPSETFTDALLKHGFSNEQVHRLVASARPVYDLGRVAARRAYWIVHDGKGDLHGLRYAVDEARYLTVYRDRDEFVAVLKDFQFERRLDTVDGVISGSLFETVTAAGETEQLALDLAKIFTYDVDFYTDIQEGDGFQMVVEKKYLDGRFSGYGPILGATLSSGGKTLTGYRYQTADGTVDYFAADGKSLRKSFLKSPLQFGRITSRYSRGRLHPILKIVRPHLGVDYAAPTGTPVVAVGAGVVTQAGTQGGGGRTVKLRHSEGLETLYLHLSRFAVRAGARVAQGQVIGYVGSSGLATGPHLDFRVVRHRKYINPATVIFPPAPPVPPAELARFAASRAEIEARLGAGALAASTAPSTSSAR